MADNLRDALSDLCDEHTMSVVLRKLELIANSHPWGAALADAIDKALLCDDLAKQHPNQIIKLVITVE